MNKDLDAYQIKFLEPEVRHQLDCRSGYALVASMRGGPIGELSTPGLLIEPSEPHRSEDVISLDVDDNPSDLAAVLFSL